MRKTATTALVVLALTVAGCTADQGSQDSRAGATGSTGAPAPSTDGTGGDAGEPTPVPTVTGESGGQSGGDGSETIPEPGPAPSSLAELLPDALTGAGRLEEALEDANKAKGLATGFPTDVLLVPDGATVVSSSVASDGGRTQLALDATVPGACDDVLVELRGWFRAGGFTETATAQTAARTELTFTRDDGHVTATTVLDDDACDLTLFGVLATGKSGRS